MTIKKIKGTRDIFPLIDYTTMCNNLRSYLLLHNFQEMHTPIFEFESLFSKNLGLGSDIVNKEMYFVSHKHSTVDENKEKIVLRPELTASMMRAYFENNIQECPTKLFQIGSVFRHERPQKGRYREFFQCSIEIINGHSIGYDVHLVALLYNFFQSHIPRKFQLEINYLGSQEERQSYKNALYQYCLAHKNKFPELIQNMFSQETILRVLDNKNPEIKDVVAHAPSIFDFFTEDSMNTWHRIIKQFDALQIPYIHNTKLVRGLDYYNNLIFEFTSDSLGSQNAFCGGGRYDSLSKNFNNTVIPSLGAGIGIDRLLLLLEGCLTNQNNNTLIAIMFNAPIIDLTLHFALTIQHTLGQHNIQSDIYFDKTSLKSSLKKANAEDAAWAIIIQEDSITTETCILKNMYKEYCQSTISVKNIISFLKDNKDNMIIK